MLEHILLWLAKFFGLADVELVKAVIAYVVKIVSGLELTHLAVWLWEEDVGRVFLVLAGSVLAGAVLWAIRSKLRPLWGRLPFGRIWAVFKEARLQERLPFGRRPVVAVSVIGAVLVLALALGVEFQTLVVPSRTLTGHTGSVISIAFSPDGRTLASGSEVYITPGSEDPSTIKLWDTVIGQAVRTLTTLTGQYYLVSVAFSPDGRTLASGSDTIKLWEVISGQVLRTFTDTKPVRSVGFSPDGRTLASGGVDKTIKLWEVASGQVLRTLTGHTGSVNSVAFSPDGRTLASGSDDETIKLWEAASGQVLRTLTGHTGSVNSVAFSPDGRTLASGSDDKTIKLWDAASDRPLRSLSGYRIPVFSVAFSPDGRILASGSDTIKLWRVASGQVLRTLTDTKPVLSVVFSPDGRTLASGGDDKTIKLWDLSNVNEASK